MMPISDPRDRFFYPHHTHMKDTYIFSSTGQEHPFSGLSAIQFLFRPPVSALALFEGKAFLNIAQSPEI